MTLAYWNNALTNQATWPGCGTILCVCLCVCVWFSTLSLFTVLTLGMSFLPSTTNLHWFIRMVLLSQNILSKLQCIICIFKYMFLLDLFLLQYLIWYNLLFLFQPTIFCLTAVKDVFPLGIYFIIWNMSYLDYVNHYLGNFQSLNT